MAETNSITGKACGKCGEVQEFFAFNKNKNRPDGLSWDCRECNKARSKAAFEANKSRYNETSKAHYEQNKSSYVTKAKDWAAANREKRREVAKEYARRNPSARHETSKKYRLKNPGLYAAHFKARQQRKRKAMPKWANVESIKAIYRQCAWVTRMTGIAHHVDHYYPLKNPLVCGLHNEYNLRIIPAAVNLSKGNQIPTG